VIPWARRWLVLRAAVRTGFVGLAASGIAACDEAPAAAASRVVSVPAHPLADPVRALHRRPRGLVENEDAPAVEASPPRQEPNDPDASVPTAPAPAAPAPPPPHFGRAFHFVTPIRAEAGTPEGQRPLGYLRRGARFLAHGDAVAAPGCEPGWRTLLTGGVVCPGRGVVIGSTPPGEPVVSPPVPPDETAALPYAHVRVRYATWELFRRPEDRPAFAALPEPALPSAQPATSSPEGEADSAAGPSAAGPASDSAATPARPASEDAPAPVPDRGAPLPELVRGPLAPGWFVSVDREELTPDGMRFLRTVRGTWVAEEAVTRVGGPGDDAAPEARGVHLVPGCTLPLAFPVTSRGARLLRRTPGSGEATPTLRVDQPVPLTPDAPADADGRWSPTADGNLLRRSDVRIARRRPRPPEIAADERWIHVDLSEQVLVAYEGDRPVFATLVSTGRAETPTPAGVHRIDAKHVTITMDGDGSDPAAEAYRIDDVPWVQFFSGGYALHGAFWHDGFGRPRSHGCVNLAPGDARWLFQFTAPSVPAGWHGRFRERGEATTAVVVDP